MESGGSAARNLSAPCPPNKPSASDVPDLSRIQAKVTLAQTLGLTRSDADYYALQLGNHVLGGAFYATRLYRDLREETGLVYYVTSTFDLGVTRSLYGASLRLQPGEHSESATHRCARSCADADNSRDSRGAPAGQGPTAQGDSALGIERGAGSPRSSSISPTHFLPLDEPILAARRYVDLTAEQVRTAYEKWLRPGDLVEVVEGPPPK